MTPENGDKPPIQIEYLHPEVILVGNDDPLPGIHQDPGTPVELTFSLARFPEGTQQFPFRGEEINPVVAFVRHQNPTPRVHPDPVYRAELPRTGSRFSKGQRRPYPPPPRRIFNLDRPTVGFKNPSAEQDGDQKDNHFTR